MDIIRLVDETNMNMAIGKTILFILGHRNLENYGNSEYSISSSP